ncbi:MAG: hypothetical protein WAV53_22350, partial [Anaerolineae bacterium]
MALRLPAGIQTGFTGLTGYSNSRGGSFAHHRARILFILFILSKSACRVSSYGLTGYSNSRGGSFAHHRARILFILFILSKSACLSS